MGEVERLEEGREEGDRPVGEVASQHPGLSEALYSMPHPPLPFSKLLHQDTKQFPTKSTDSCLGPFSFAETEHPTG